jgi:hypothetical protein
VVVCGGAVVVDVGGEGEGGGVEPDLLNRITSLPMTRLPYSFGWIPWPQLKTNRVNRGPGCVSLLLSRDQ